MRLQKGQMLFEISNLEYKEKKETKKDVFSNTIEVVKTYHIGSFTMNTFVYIKILHNFDIVDNNKVILRNVIVTKSDKEDNVYRYHFYTKMNVRL